MAAPTLSFLTREMGAMPFWSEVWMLSESTIQAHAALTLIFLTC